MTDNRLEVLAAEVLDAALEVLRDPGCADPRDREAALEVLALAGAADRAPAMTLVDRPWPPAPWLFDFAEEIRCALDATKDDEIVLVTRDVAGEVKIKAVPIASLPAWAHRDFAPAGLAPRPFPDRWVLFTDATVTPAQISLHDMTVQPGRSLA